MQNYCHMGESSLSEGSGRNKKVGLSYPKIGKGIQMAGKANFTH